MKYPLLSALVFLFIVTATNTMEEKSKITKLKIRSNSVPVPRLTQNLEALESHMETPHKRPSPNTDKALEEYDKKNALPSPRPGSPKTSPRPITSPRIMSPRGLTSPRRSVTVSSSYPGIEVTRARENSKVLLAAKENK